MASLTPAAAAGSESDAQTALSWSLGPCPTTNRTTAVAHLPPLVQRHDRNQIAVGTSTPNVRPPRPPATTASRQEPLACREDVPGSLREAPPLRGLHGVERGCVGDLQLVTRVGARASSGGSLALELALRTCHLDQGDEVIIPSFCCSTVVAPILAVGATPVLADVSSDLNLTAETVDAARTRRTRGSSCPICSAIRPISKRLSSWVTRTISSSSTMPRKRLVPPSTADERVLSAIWEY